MILLPAPPNSGIVLCSLADDTPIPVDVKNVSDTGYNTTLTSGECSIRTVEHLLSALHAFGITNLLVKTEDEIPALDGSSLEICKQICDAGITNQNAMIEPIRIPQKIQIGTAGDGLEFIAIVPADHLIVDYTLDYPKPIGRQRMHFELTSPDVYVREVAPARTFALVSEFRKLSEMGRGSGGRLDNLILVDDQRVVNTRLRFSNEFARHKVLDLIGDLFLLGRPVLGHITASKTGHSDNLALMKKVRESLQFQMLD
jgi:UDP-3-O-[3-hydroxymyristoyl] N-acetylglucosamine deacetylase